MRQKHGCVLGFRDMFSGYMIKKKRLDFGTDYRREVVYVGDRFGVIVIKKFLKMIFEIINRNDFGNDFRNNY